MKQILICLFSIFIVSNLFGQEINQKKFDQFDSIYKVSTTQEMLGGSIYELNKTLFASAVKFSSMKKTKEFADYTLVYVFNAPERAYSLDGNSYVQIIFSDGTSKKYMNEGKYSVYGKDDGAAQYFTINEDDPIVVKEIKAIRFSHSNGSIDLDVTHGTLIKDMISLVNKEPLDPK